jgi:polyhydroxybutyrate depolymerase
MPRLMLLAALVSTCLLVAGCRDRGGDSPTATPTLSTTPTATSTVDSSGTPLVQPRPGEVGTHEHSINIAGRGRSYLLHVPPAYDGVTPLPLVLVFHGGGGRAESAVRMTHMDEVADEHGFLAVFPDGSGRLADALLTFNAGTCCGYATNEGIDDVGFARELIGELTSTLAVDPRRVYVTGMSNGGMMSYRLACEASDLIAAAAPVAGALNISPCRPSEPISLIAFHGTEDESVLYDGGEPITRIDPNPRNDTSVAASVGFFVEHNGCDSLPESAREGGIAVDRWSGCSDGTAVELYTVEGYGHSWPGGEPGFRGASVPTQEIDASQIMWRFFEAHPKTE